MFGFKQLIRNFIAKVDYSKRNFDDQDIVKDERPRTIQEASEVHLVYEDIYNILEVLPACISAQNPDTKEIMYVNKQFRENIGNIAGRKCYQVHYQNDSPCENCIPMQIVRNEQPMEWERKYRRDKFFHIWGYPLTLAGKEGYVLELAVDVTAQRENEKKIIEYQQKLKVLVSEISKNEETRRKLFADLIHEDIAQTVSAAKMKLETMQNTLTSHHREAYNNVLSNLETAIQKSRDLSFQLSPLILYNFGLDYALSHLAEWAEYKYKNKCSYSALKPNNKNIDLPAEQAILVFRAVSQTIDFVGDNSKSANIEIDLQNLQNSIKINVKIKNDSKIAKKLNTLKKSVLHIEEQLKLFDADLDIDSTDQGQSNIIITAHLKK